MDCTALRDGSCAPRISNGTAVSESSIDGLDDVAARAAASGRGRRPRAASPASLGSAQTLDLLGTGKRRLSLLSLNKPIDSFWPTLGGYVTLDFIASQWFVLQKARKIASRRGRG